MFLNYNAFVVEIGHKVKNNCGFLKRCFDMFSEMSMFAKLES